MSQPVLAAPAAAGETLATVGDSVITVQEYAMALRSEARRRFYHFSPPEEQLVAFRREVAEMLIERTLAAQEAKRRGLRTDRKAVDGRLEKMRANMARRNRDHQADDRFWAALRHEIEIEQLVQQLREQERAQISPTDAKLRAYYRAHPDKFTEPERVRVSVILLRVHPSSPQSVWDAAQREGEQLVARLREGADFGELARLHSADTTTAAKGGDVGYVHKGMLSSVVDEALAAMQPGEITPPLTVLEGVAIFKLDAREPARLGDYQHVKTRVLELWQIAEEERSWKALMSRLRSETTVVIEEKHLTPG